MTKREHLAKQLQEALDMVESSQDYVEFEIDSNEFYFDDLDDELYLDLNDE